MNRFPLSRCASVIQIVRPSESTAEPQPKLQPRFLRLSAMISQYFTAVYPTLPFFSKPRSPEKDRSWQVCDPTAYRESKSTDTSDYNTQPKSSSGSLSPVHRNRSKPQGRSRL